MVQDAITVEAKYQKFVERICVSETVWGLQSEAGWAVSESNDFEDTELLPFWSDRAYAAACAKNEWSTYIPTPIPLAEFLESWCVGIYNDGGLIATNMDVNMFGREVEPLELILEVLKQADKIFKALSFRDYESPEMLRKQVQTILKT
ncbi:DUF2750 domain-containing protein [Hymenobacter sp. BRD128]|uniref:DUF2750 domain-containing protein n=1 Tax=Hymenobacter sp. BRD128 TaxID=2675878 RepID=UPI00156387B4|nr:DUF2750 domain-containing protein [Hymenobacter sp. BRD128]QKG58758.1 DUF2750 domain-containing protein [Hymenobacter sp. BRD128]